ncbi:MAG: hypothetical protein QMB87_00655 [Flavobacteriales bacterium]|jgi:hypothetical protein
MLPIHGSNIILESLGLISVKKFSFPYKGSEGLEFSVTKEYLSSAQSLGKEDLDIRVEEEMNVFSMKPWSFIRVETQKQ